MIRTIDTITVNIKQMDNTMLALIIFAFKEFTKRQTNKVIPTPATEISRFI